MSNLERDVCTTIILCALHTASNVLLLLSNAQLSRTCSCYSIVPRPHPLAYRASRGGVWVQVDRARRTLACLVVSYSPQRFLIDVETTSAESETE